jgi:hypothetical protein
MSISDDLIERINKLFYIYFKDDPEFQYTESDYEEKDIITEIDREKSTKYLDEIHLHFKSDKIRIIKNLNITKNLIVYPYFYDFLPPHNITESEIRYFVNDKEVSRDKLTVMLFEKESVNADRNIHFVFPKTCMKNIGNKLYINEFGREIVQLTINYINFKLIDKLLVRNLWYEERLERLENKLELEKTEMNEKGMDVYLKDYVKIEHVKPNKQEIYESSEEENKNKMKKKETKSKKEQKVKETKPKKEPKAKKN